MSISEHFMAIIPRHRKVLEDLHKIHGRGYGEIGWKGLMEENEPFTAEQLFQPLLDRGLIEDLTNTELGSRGVYFVRITPLGILCLALGLMLKQPRKTSEQEMKKLGASDIKPAEEGLSQPGT